MNGDLDPADRIKSESRTLMTDSYAGPAPFLDVTNLTKSFVRQVDGKESRHLVLDDISCSAEKQEFLAVIGPSGCGKSTLLNCIAGLADPDAGQILLQDVRIDGPGLDLAVVFQHANLLPWRTIRTNISYGLELRRNLARKEIAARVNEAVALVGLRGYEDHYPHQISGGMQQRANLARALAVRPKLILMDEPFGALDAMTKEVLQDQLSSLSSELDQMTMLMITHDITEAVFLADKILVMSTGPGRIVETVDVLFERPRNRQDVLGNPEFARLVQQLRALLAKSSGAVR